MPSKPVQFEASVADSFARATVGQLGQAEVEDFSGAAIDEEKSGRLDVAMHDALGVGRFQAVGNLYADFQNVGVASCYRK